jgi:hypothetical protein
VRSPRWLPADLTPEQVEAVNKLAGAIDFEIDTAAAIAVALLEEVNAHREAHKVNDLLAEELGS